MNEKKKIKEDIYWQKQRTFWEIYSLEELKIEQEKKQREEKQKKKEIEEKENEKEKERITREELHHNIDNYNPHGCYHYGGTLPLTLTQQTPAVIVRSSRVWRNYHYIIPKKLDCFHQLMKLQQEQEQEEFNEN